MAKTHGPIETPNDFLPGDPGDVKGDISTCFNGIDGYPKGTGGKLPEVVYDELGGFSGETIAKREKE